MAEGAMAGPVETLVVEGVALVTIDNPPVNALSHPVRAGLVAAIAAAEADPAVAAIVLTGAGRTFPAGADIREFDTPPQDPWLPEVCERIEDCPKPVVAALHGTALGGGFELALAAHWRIAQASARIGLPEVTLGLLPGAGGTQRAPRLAGAAAALGLMLSGRPLAAPGAQAAGLIDEVAAGDLIDASLARARALAIAGAPAKTRERRDGLADPVAFEAEIRRHRAVPANPDLPAPGRIVDCVEAALLLPFAAGMEFEAEAFADCLASPASAGLRHGFLAERRAARVPHLAGVEAAPVARAGVLGAGLAGGGSGGGAGLLAALLAAGIEVTVLADDEAALAAALEPVAVLHQRAVEGGRMTEAAREAEWARLAGATDPAALARVAIALVLDPAPAVALARAAAAVPPGTPLLATLDAAGVEALAAAAGRPGDVVGLVLPSPRLVEVVAGSATAPAAQAAAMALVRRLGRVAVLARGRPPGAAILAALDAAMGRLLAEGGAPDAIEAALAGFGLAPDAPADAPANASLRARTAPEAAALLAAMANAGAGLVAEGAALRPSDIDIAMIVGHGFARWRGGPMKAADLAGLPTLRKTLLARAEASGDGAWQPHPLLLDLIKKGRHFADLDGA